MLESKYNDEKMLPSESYYGELKVKQKVKERWYHKVRRVFYSALIFTVCYIAVVILYQQILKILLVSYGFTTTDVNYNEVKNLPIDTAQWNRRIVTFVFGGTPAIFLLFALSGIIILRFMKGRYNVFRLAVLWLIILCFNLFYTSVIIAPAGNLSYVSVLYNGFAVVAAWWYITNFYLIPVSALFVFISILTGLIIGYEFMKFSHSKSLLQTTSGRNLFLTQTFLLPVLVSAIPLILLTNKYSFELHMVFIANLLLMGAGMYLRNEVDRRGARTMRTNTLNRTPFAEALIAFAVWVAVYWFFR